jgi:nitrous oxidase accessory protein
VIEVCPTCVVNRIESGISIANDSDTVQISGGEYFVENIIIRKSLTLLGNGGATLISKSGDEILTLLANGITVQGLTFKDVTTSYLKERSAIRVKKKKGFRIEDNKIINCFFGIYLEHAKDGVVKGNRILGNATTEAASGNAIHAWYCEEINIIENEVRGHRDGIYFEFVNQSKVQNNRSEGNTRYGLHFMFSNDDSYTDNTFRNNGVGVAVMFSRRIQMFRNTFSYNWGRTAYGLLLKEIYDAEISHNRFEQNTIGIFVEGSNRILYTQNVFKQNGWAIKFSGGCEANEITQNNFLYNSLDLIVNTKLQDNRFYANYWSAYSGYDLDKNGVGDIPHYPVKLFSYILNEAPEAIVLMRSFFVDIINFSEKVSPVFTPKEVMDSEPAMQAYDL